ncbi:MULTISPECIES: DUF2066 domain-containing protein [unclassified Stenotrophomonas]|uniref:DUF2066 domain-containing protein n=1 Tax=unclassified Stenotrophomonas TaxID=196198 RepID=UPI00177F7BE7|nr:MULTISPECIES: DUF2066 domain-containing protein [unclassified Stenotrophomonas]MBD8642306.1 DUF2066 domain-containing protein [Stenotrophomonas sp. CFBP 13724]MDY1032859.1 DUF2066 domain-containing protein [Stenotrophomonas sp. CFBP8980]
MEVQMPRSPLRTTFLIMLLAACLPFAALAQSGPRTEGDVATASGAYEAEVPVRGQSDADRNGGLSRALAEVLGKLSGDRNITARPGVVQALRNAKDYVQSYDYKQDQSTSASGAPNFRTLLVARFREDDVDAMVAALGLPVWPQPRPKPVLWLAIDDGSGPRLVTVQQANAVRPVLARAVERGFKLGLPTGSTAEQALVGAIWRQDTAAVARASARYAPPMQLIGKLSRADGGWTADWVFVDNGRELNKWTTKDANAMRAMAGGADGAADALVRRYAKPGAATGQAGTYRIVVTGIDSADDYMRLAAGLREVPVVRNIIPLRAVGNRLELSLEMTTGLAGLNRMLGEDGVLVPVAPVAITLDGDEQNPAPASNEYRLR